MTYDNYWKKTQAMKRKVRAVIEENIDSVIRCGEFDPSESVIKEVCAILVEYHGSDILYEVIDGDREIAEFLWNRESLAAGDRVHKLLQKWAFEHLERNQDMAWDYWEEQRMAPVEDYR